LSVSGKLRCSKCNDELGKYLFFSIFPINISFVGQGSAMVIESLGLYYHIECFRCCVCNIPLSSSLEGTDVRVRSHRLHCQNCFSDENGENLSFFYPIIK
jgi:F-box protein 20